MNNKHFKLPKVKLVGQTALNLDELKSYLEETDQLEFLKDIDDAKSEGLSDGEILCSFYAKSCYASLTTKKNKNISKVRDIKSNIKGIVESEHGCFDADTEVLTNDGWKFWQDVTENDYLATRRSDGNLEYHKPIRLINYYHQGRMFRVQSPQVDLFVTPDHKMLACKTTTREGRTRENYQLIPAQELAHISHSYIKSSNPWNGSNYVSENIAKLLGFSIGDGYIIENLNSTQIGFHLKRIRKIIFLKEICKLESLELKEDKENDKYIVYLPSNLGSLFRSIYNENGEKQIPNSAFSWLFNSLLGLFIGLINSDGSVSDTGDMYDTTSYRLAGQIQHLSLLLGFAANISQAECYKKREKSFGTKPIYRLSFPLRCLKPEVNKWSGQKGKSFWVENWEGEVFCAEVPNNTLYVRRNGKPVWSGNSVFEHCFLNFMIYDCSRVFTHELVRHRAGTAFSQTSGRYVRSDEINLVIDPILAPIYELCEEVRDYLEKWYHRAESGMSLNNIKDFSTKKKITSALRRLMPNGQCNEIGFSVNIRCLRHTIEARTSEHAEWEIRVIFNEIYKIIKSKYSIMFFDAIEEMKDGLLEIKFKNKKI